MGDTLKGAKGKKHLTVLPNLMTHPEVIYQDASLYNPYLRAD